MKIAALAVAGLVAAGVVAPAIPAQAATPKAWMSVKEFKKIKRGMTLGQVRSIVGSRGRIESSSQWTTGGIQPPAAASTSRMAG